jgi:hypothetical protein
MPLLSPVAVNEASRLLNTAAPPQPRGGREIAALFKDSIPGSCLLHHDSLSWAASLYMDLVANDTRGNLSVIFSYILQNSIQTVSIVIVGRLGATELSVAAFSLMLAFVTG